MDRVPVNEARKRFGDILSRAHYAGEITLITKHDKDIAAVVPTDLLDDIDQLTPKKKPQKVVRDPIRTRGRKP